MFCARDVSGTRDPGQWCHAQRPVRPSGLRHASIMFWRTHLRICSRAHTRLFCRARTRATQHERMRAEAGRSAPLSHQDRGLPRRRLPHEIPLIPLNPGESRFKKCMRRPRRPVCAWVKSAQCWIFLVWRAGAEVFSPRPFAASYSRSSSSLTVRIRRRSSSLTLIARQRWAARPQSRRPRRWRDRGRWRGTEPGSPPIPSAVFRRPVRTPLRQPSPGDAPRS